MSDFKPIWTLETERSPGRLGAGEPGQMYLEAVYAKVYLTDPNTKRRTSDSLRIARTLECAQDLLERVRDLVQDVDEEDGGCCAWCHKHIPTKLRDDEVNGGLCENPDCRAFKARQVLNYIDGVTP